MHTITDALFWRIAFMLGLIAATLLAFGLVRLFKWARQRIATWLVHGASLPATTTTSSTSPNGPVPRDIRGVAIASCAHQTMG